MAMAMMFVGIHSTHIQEERTVSLCLMECLLVTVLDAMQSLHVKRTVLVTYAVLDHLAMLRASVRTLVSHAQEKMVTALLNAVVTILVDHQLSWVDLEEIA